MSKFEWKPKIRNYKTEEIDINNNYANGLVKLGNIQTADHPLSNKKKNNAVKVVMASSDPLSSSSGLDPLRAGSPLPYVDPLSARLDHQPSLIITGQLNRQIGSRQKAGYLNWAYKKQKYLKKYTTDKNIPIISNIMEEEEGKVIKLEDRLKMRLDELDREEKEQDTQYMAQKDYLRHLEKLNEELKDAWNNQNDRVKSLKIVIKCSKILGRNTVPQFYPSMFVLVSEVLDTFGKLIYKRIAEKNSKTDPITGKVISKLPKNFTVHDVTEDAKEVCRNWHYKVASIRELLGRVYLEMTILSSYKFLYEGDKRLKKDLVRLAKEIRGIGDPLIANYARCYLARKGFELLPDEKDYLMILFDDFVFTQQQFEEDHFQKFLNKTGINRGQYMDLLAPPLDWILEVLGKDAGEPLFHKVLDRYQKEGKSSAIFLNSIISSFEAHLVSHAASILIYEIKQCDDSLPKHQLFKSLGEQFCVCPPDDSHKLELLNEIWKYVTAMKDIKDYISVVEVFIEFVCKSFTLKEVNILMKDLLNHLKSSGLTTFETVEEEIQNILLTVLENTDDFIKVFNLQQFLPLFDMLSTTRKVQVSKGMLKAFAKRKSATAADPVVISSLFDLAITVHDSVNALSEEFEKEEVCEALVGFVNGIDFGMALEKQLNFFTDCRRSFCMFDRINEALVIKTLNMIAKTYKFVKAQHTTKTSSFVKACVSFCHITIPSLSNLFKRTKLFVLTGQYAVMNNLLPQANALFKIAIETMNSIPRIETLPDNTVVDNTEELVSMICWISSCFVSVPGHPEQGPFYLMRGLLNLIQEYDWGTGSDAKIRLFIYTLSTLSALSQQTLPYRYTGVSSNDELFMEDDDYKEQLIAIGNTIIEKAVEEIIALGKDEDFSSKKKQALCAAELLNSIVFLSSLNNKLLDLIGKLYALAKGDDKAFKIFTHVKNAVNTLANAERTQVIGYSSKDPIMKKQFKQDKQQFAVVCQVFGQ
nr:unnamed protein product [Naegleria fowleri]